MSLKDYQIVWRGFISSSTGGGIAGGEYILALDRLGVDVKIDHTLHHFPVEDPNKTKRFKELMNKPYASNKPKILIYHSPPYNIDPDKERSQFDYIMLNTVWETTQIPHSWFPTINSFDAVCVPSQQNIKALQESGVTVPIFLAPHGVDTQIFSPDNEKLPLQIADGTFIFVSVFDFQHRKNPEGLLRAYWEEFKPDENVSLLLKTSWRGNSKRGYLIHNSIMQLKKDLGLGEETAPLCLITNILEGRELCGVYTLGQAFVLPTRGEGVGMPFMEALASGIPVIATGWGGQMDYLDEGNSFLVDYKLESPAGRMNEAISLEYRLLFAEDGQLWAEPEKDSLKKQMRYAYENPSLCSIKGAQGRMDMLKYSWDYSGAALKEAVERLLEKERRG